LKAQATIPATLVPEALMHVLKLEKKSYIMIIPKHLVDAAGVTADALNFDLILENGKLLLASTTKSRATRTPGINKRSR